MTWFLLAREPMNNSLLWIIERDFMFCLHVSLLLNFLSFIIIIIFLINVPFELVFNESYGFGILSHMVHTMLYIYMDQNRNN